MAINEEQLRKLQEIKRGLEATRNAEKGDSWSKLSQFVLQELSQPEEKKGLYSDTAGNYTTLATNALQGWAYGEAISWMHIAREDRNTKGKGEPRDTSAWFRQVERLLLDDFSRAGFYVEALAFTKIGLNLSTAIMLMDWDEAEESPVFENLNPRRCCIAQDNRHEVDTLFYEFEMDKDSAEKAFGDKCPKKIMDCKDWTKKFTFTKAIFSSTRYDMDIDGEGEWCEVIWGEDDKKHACSERRLSFRPFVCWRFERSLTGSAWGANAPGERCLSTIVALNVLEKAKLRAIQLRSQPPVKATEGLEVNIVPDGITYLRSGQDYQYAPLPGSSEETLVEIQQKEAVLREAYYVDFFLMLQQTLEKQKTATEAALLSDEKSQIMSSFASRLNNEFLEPLLETMVDMEMTHGRLPKPPRDIAGQELKVDFISPLAVAQRKAQVYVPARQFIAETLAFAEIDPSVRYIFKVPEYAQAMAQDLMIDMRFINSPEDVEKRVQQDQQMMQQQMQMQNAQQGAQTLAALGKAPEDGSIAQNMMSAQGGAR